MKATVTITLQDDSKLTGPGSQKLRGLLRDALHKSFTTLMDATAQPGTRYDVQVEVHNEEEEEKP
jgi:hypothetical protein